MLEPDLIDYLVSNVPSAGGRVYLGNAPQNVETPAVVVIRVSGSTPRTLSGVALFQRADVQIATVGDDRYAPVLTTANEVRAALDGYKGVMRNTRIESCRGRSDPADASFIDGNKVMRQLTQDFHVVYRDA